MKTNDFIKMLQKEDPTGEAFIRINNEPMISVELKPGYWDSPYNYIEKIIKVKWFGSNLLKIIK